MVRDLSLIIGGLFLVWKATTEIHEALEGDEGHATGGRAATMRSVLLQIVLQDVVLSLDSVLTAVGMADDVAMGFSVFVEMLNLAARRRRERQEPVELRTRFVNDTPAPDEAGS